MRDRLLPTLLILGVLYADVATTANLTNWSLRLPIPGPVYRAFGMFSVFDTWDDENVEYVAEVELLALDGRRGPPERRPFDLYAYFPAPPSDARARINRLLIRDPNVLLSEIWRVYERSHPGDIVNGVRLYVERWPKSPGGYETARDPRGGQSLVESTEVVAVEGWQQVRLSFPAARLLATGEDGPYDIASVELLAVGGSGSQLPPSRLSDAGRTQVFQLNQLEGFAQQADAPDGIR